MATPQEVILNFMSSLDNTTLRSTAALDEAVKAVSNYAGWDEAISTMIKDCQAYGGDYERFLKDMCDIVLDNDDTGAITGSDAGGDTTKTAESVIPENGSWTYPDSTSFTIQGFTVNVPERDTLSESEQYIIGALYTWWIDQSLTLAKDSFGMSFEEDGASVTSIDVEFYDRADSRLAAVDYETGQKTTQLTLNINMHYYNAIDQDNPNGYSEAASIVYLDRTIAHELVHAIMAANVDYFNSLPVSFKEGSAELVHGIDDKRYNNIKNLAGSYTRLRSAFAGSGSNTYAAGYMLLRYLAKQSSADRDPAEDIVVEPIDTDTGDSGTTVIDTDTGDSGTTIVDTGTTIVETDTYSAVFNVGGTELTASGDLPDNIWLGGADALTGAASAYGNSSTVTLNGSAVTTNIIFAGNTNDNLIQAGSGGSSIWGGDGANDTLVGGDGRDMFWFGQWSGNDVITNFNGGTDDESDVINLFSDGLTSATRSSEYVTLNMIDGSTLNISISSGDVDEVIQYSTNATDINRAKIGETDGENSFTYEDGVEIYGGANAQNTLVLTDDTGSNEIWLDRGTFENITVIDAESSSVDNLMAGNDRENTIIGGSGTSSLWGGMHTVNDTLIGGSGDNYFWYGITDGNDVIQNAKEGDVVNLYDISLDDIVSIGETNGDLVMTTRLGTLTITDGAAPTMTFADGTSRRFNYDSGNLE